MEKILNQKKIEIKKRIKEITDAKKQGINLDIFYNVEDLSELGMLRMNLKRIKKICDFT